MNYINSIQLDKDDDTTKHDIEVSKVGYYTSSATPGYYAATPSISANATLEVQSNKLSAAGSTVTANTAIYLNRTSTTKYVSAKAVYEYIQSLL